MNFRLLSQAILALVLFMGFVNAPLQAATTFTTTVADKQPGLSSPFWLSGFRFNLNPHFDCPHLQTISSSESIKLADFNTINLEAITLYDVYDLNGVSNVYMALVDASGKVVCMSDNSISGTGESTWNFKDTTISSSADIFMVFTKRGHSTGDVLASSDMALLSARRGISGIVDAPYDDDFSSFGNIDDPSMNPSDFHNTPDIKITTSADSIPEPSTATLGLVALVGLLSRRRRV